MPPRGKKISAKPFKTSNVTIEVPKRSAAHLLSEDSGEGEVIQMFSESEEDCSEVVDKFDASESNSDSDDAVDADELTSDVSHSENEESDLDDDNFQGLQEKKDMIIDNVNDSLILRDGDDIVDIPSAQVRIQRIIGILKDYKAYVASVEENSSLSKIARADFLRQVRRDLAAVYDYNEYLISKIIDLFPISEVMDFIEANEVERPLIIRVNTLKTKRRDLAGALAARGASVQPLDLPCSVNEKIPQTALKVVSSTIPIGATPEYLAGYYMLQAASSMLPVLSLNPQINQRVLDMSAAPGGKSTHIAALMGNTGQLFSNDLSKARLPALTANLHRMGVQNVVVTCLDGREFPAVIGGFSRVLLDAPCSGTGVISKDKEVKVSRSEEDVARLVMLQKELILAAIDATEVNGNLVYSTCSILVEENEAVVDYCLRRRPNVKLVDTGLEGCGGRAGFANFCGKAFHPSMRLTRRFYPHLDDMDGFFVSKFVKHSQLAKPSEPGVLGQGLASKSENSAAANATQKGKKRKLDISNVKSDLDTKTEMKGALSKVTKAASSKVTKAASSKVIKAASSKVIKAASSKVIKAASSKVQNDVSVKVQNDVSAQVQNNVSAKVQNNVSAKVQKAASKKTTDGSKVLKAASKKAIFKK